MDKQLRRILDLVRKTGDRMVVTDTNGEDVFVVMGLDQYEDLVLPEDGFDEDGPEDREDWDEGWWNDGGPDDFGPVDPLPSDESPPPKNLWEAMQPAGEKGETWDMSKMNEEEKANLERQFNEYQKVKAQESAVTEEIKAEKEPEVEVRKTDEEFGEEQFYLEPIE